VGPAAGVDAGSAECGVEVEFGGADGVCRLPLEACGSVAFEDVAPARVFRWSRGQRHFPGWWWLATTARHVGYESWLERDHVMLLDSDPAVTAVSSGPVQTPPPARHQAPRHEKGSCWMTPEK
jgi:hypothetical protein